MKFKIGGRWGNTTLKFSGEFEPGLRISILGRSGAGKTTLLRFLSGLEINGQSQIDVNGAVNQKPWKRRVGYLHQQPVMFAHHRVAQTLKLASSLAKGKLPLPVDQWYERLAIGHLISANTRELSGGQQQRVALLRLLLAQPEWICLDESFSSLDEKNTLAACEVVDDYLKITGAGLLIASHDQVPHRILADHAYLINNLHGTFHPNLFTLLNQQTEADVLNTLFVEASHEHQGYLALTLGDNQLYCTKPERWVAGQCRVSVSGYDLVISKGEARTTSMLNTMAGDVSAIHTMPNSRSKVRISIGDQALDAVISHWSVARLALKPGDRVWVECKVSSLHWHGQH